MDKNIENMPSWMRTQTQRQGNTQVTRQNKELVLGNIIGHFTWENFFLGGGLGEFQTLIQKHGFRTYEHICQVSGK